MAAWRGLITRRRQLFTRAVLLEDAAARRLLGSVWCAWRVLVDEGAVRRHRVELVILVRQQQLTGRVLRRWLAQVRVAAVLRAAAEQIKRRRERSLLPAAFAAWCAAARLTADGPHGNDGDARGTTTRLMGALQRLLGYSRRDGLARRVLSAWRHLTSASLQLQATATAVARMRRRTRTVAALACWRKVTRGCAALRWQLVADHQRARLRRVLRAWSKAAADGRQLRLVRALAGRRLGFRRRFSLFHAWRGLVELRRELWHSAVRRHSRALATSVLAGWRRRCATVRAGIAALGRCRQGYERQLLQVALHVMRSRVVLRHRMQRWERQQVVMLIRGILRAWRCWAARSARRSGFGRLLRKKWRRLVARGVLRAWFVASHSVALQALLLEAMQAGGGIRCAASCRWHDGGGPQAIFPSVSVSARATALAAAALPQVERPQGAILRILMVSHGGLSITGGRGGAAATAAVTEMLCMRLPTLVRLAMQPRRLAHVAFNTWRFVVACQVQLKAIATRIKARCRSLLLYAYFKRWVSTVADGRARRAAAMAMARRLVRGWAATCLLAWAQEARLFGRLRRTCLKLLARRMGRMARAVILAWRTAVREQRERVQDKLRNRLDIRLALLHRAVQGWQLAVATAAEMREAAEKRYTAAWMRFKRQVLLSWRRQTVFSLQNLITCSRLLQTRAERRLLAAVTAAWSTYTRIERQRREDWPMMCRVFYAWRTLVQSAGRTATAATAAAVAAELDVQRLQHVCANAAVAPFTSIAATAVASPQARSIAPSSVARDEFDCGASATVDPGSLSSPGIVNPSSVRCNSDVEERNALAGVLAAQNIAWQPWYGMLQSGGGLAALPGGPILLPLLANMVTMAGADGGSGDVSALRELLGRLDDPVRRVERGDGAREDGGAIQAQVQPAAVTTAGSAPVSFPTAQPPHPARAMTASCQPEPRPQSQKGPSSSTAASRATALFVAPSEESPTGGMATAPLPPSTAATQGNSMTTAAGSAAPAAAAAAAIAANDLAQQVSLQPLKTPTSRALSASVPPEPGPLFQIRQGSSTTIGRASNKSLGLREATDSIPRSVDSQVGLATAATQQGALEPAALQVTAPSAPGAREQQTHKQQGHQPQQQEHLRQQQPQQQIQWQQQKEQGHPQRITAPSTPDILSSSEIGAESGPLFQVRDGSSVTVGCARTGLAGALQPFDFGFNDATNIASAAAKAPDEASHHVDQGARAHAISAMPTLSILPPPPPPLQPPGLARSSDRVLTASCAPESARMSAQIQQNRGSSSSMLLSRSSSGAISAVEPSGWAANMAGPQTLAIEAGASTRASAPTTAAPSVVPHTINIILQPYPHSHARPTHSPPSRSASHGVSPPGSGNCNSGDTPHSVTSSEDTCSLASPGSLQAWSRRNTTDLVGASEAASGISLLNATSGPPAAGGEGNSCAAVQQDGYLALSLPITEGSIGQETPGAHHSTAPSRRCGSPPDATGHHYRHHALQLSPIHSPSNQFDVLISSSSGEPSYVDVIQLQPQTSSELGPKSHSHGVPARCEKLPSTPSPRGCSAGGKLSDISVIDLIAADGRAEGHQRTGKLPPQNNASLGLSHVTWPASGQALAAAAIPVAPTPRVFGNWTQLQGGCDDLAVVPGQVKSTAAASTAAAEDSSFVGQDNPYPHLTLPSQSSNWSSVESGSGIPGAVPMPGLAPQGTLVQAGLHPAPSMLVQHPRQPSASQLHPGGAVANGAWTGPNSSTAVGQSAPVRRSFSHGTTSSWASSSVGPALAVPATVLASSIEASEHLSGPVLHGAYELAYRRTTESSFTPSTATQQGPQPQTGSMGCADGRMQGDSPAGRLESTLSVRTDATSNLTPLDTNISELEALFGALEARSKSAMSSVHCTSLQLAMAGGGLAAESMIARRRLAKADTGGGATATTGGRDVGLGSRLLDGIDALLGRATTLSAPGAPIFAARDGSDAPTSYEHSCTTAESSYGESIRNDPLLAPSGAGKRPSPEKVDAAKVPVRGDLLDAALRRLEAASVNARLAAGHATAAWPAAKEGGAPVRVGQDDKRHPANVKATEEQSRAGISWQEGLADALHTEWYPSTGAAAAAIALVAGGIDRAHAASRRSGGGSAGGLLATFISGAEEVFRHQAVANGQRSHSERQPHQSLPSRLIMKQEQQEQRQRRCEGRVVRPGVWDEDDRSNFSKEDSAARATSTRLRPAALQSQAASSGRTPGRPVAQPQLQPQPQPFHGASAAGAVGPPDTTGFVHGAASPLETSEAEMEVVTVCPNRGSPVCTPQRPSPHCHGDISAGRGSSSQRRQRQERRHSERSPEGTAKQRLKWSGDDGTGTNGDHEGSAERATGDPRPRALPATSSPTQSHATLRRQSSLPSQPQPQPQSPPRSPQLRRPCADPLEEVLLIAQRRGNLALAATLAGLVRNSPRCAAEIPSTTVADQLEPHESRRSIATGPSQPHCYQQVFGASLGESAASGRAAGVRTHSAGSQNWSHGGILCGSPSTADGASIKQGMMQQSSPRNHDCTQPYRTAVLSGRGGREPDPGMGLDLTPSPQNRDSGEAPNCPNLRSPPKPAPHTPLLRHADSRSTTASGDGSSNSSSDSTVASSGGDGNGDSSICEIVAEGFNPDPLHSPLRSVLGECLRLQSSAAQLEAEGDAIVRNMVAELSPRSAVEAALNAVLTKQQQSGQGAGGSRAGSGRRLVTPIGRRG
ncbi:hypothetical protein Vretifemale_15541 [Volvox reticuliferus]|nr:hypothetical protein Vretifemale_15541 [Volvox reticuliferus]